MKASWMHNRYRIPGKLVEEFEKKIFFLVDCDKVHIQVVKPRIAWVKPLPQEIELYKIGEIIKALLDELEDKKVAYFHTYEEAKERIEA